jgi:hypothetical protein
LAVEFIGKGRQAHAGYDVALSYGFELRRLQELSATRLLNRRWSIMQHSHGLLHFFAHDFDRTLEVEALKRTHVQLQCNGIQLFLAVSRLVRSLGQVLADQTVDVFVAATLPRAVRVAEVNRYACFLGDLGVLRHLSALVVGHALAHRQRHTIKRGN